MSDKRPQHGIESAGRAKPVKLKVIKDLENAPDDGNKDGCDKTARGNSTCISCSGS